MSPLDAAASPMTSKTPEPSPLSASQTASLVKTVSQALARGESVTVVSDGRVLARFLPTGPGDDG